MKLSILAVGTKMPSWVETGYEEYAKRLPKELKPQLVELQLANRGKNTKAETCKSQEAETILSAIPAGAFVIALDVLGKPFDTPGLAKKIERWQMEFDHICIVIGGPDGLATKCLERANELWSLSKLTLPHPLVRVVLIEQLYRAWSITKNHPYHK